MSLLTVFLPEGDPDPVDEILEGVKQKKTVWGAVLGAILIFPLAFGIIIPALVIFPSVCSLEYFRRAYPIKRKQIPDNPL